MSITTRTGPNNPTAPAAMPSLAMRMPALCYGGFAYLIFLGTLLYAIGFVSREVVSKTINTGPDISVACSFADLSGADVDLRRAGQRHGSAGTRPLGKNDDFL